jgi:hypothetical protein
VTFNVVHLQKIAAESVGRKRCVSIEKFGEGGFNRVFLLTMDDGLEVIAKIPFHNAVPRRYLTASEVATMDFIRQLGLPVPKVYAWSAEGERNPVGVEYIIMEKATGTKLADIWGSLGGKEMLTVITQLVQLEAKLMQTPLSSYGSIYFSTSDFMSERTDRRLYHDSSDSDHKWCIGPAADPAFWHDGRDELDVNRGPCTNPAPFL